MAGTGRAAVYIEGERRFDLRDLPIPDVEPGAALVRMTLANICGSDLHTWRGEMRSLAPASPAGYVLGHEGTGRIAALGAGVSKDSLGRPLKEGDRVVFTYFFPCGRCYACLDDHPNACPSRNTRFGPRGANISPYFTGTYAQYFYLRPGHYVFRVPDELTDEVVAPVNCALAQVTFGLQESGFRYGDTVVLQGGGGLGLNAAAVAKDMGASKVVVIDRVPARLELAKRFGADETIDASDDATPEARVARVRQMTNGVGAHVVMDLVGSPQVIPEGLDMLRQGGTYVEIGGIWPTSVAIDPSRIVFGNRHIVGMSHYHPRTLPVALDFLVRTAGRYPFEQLLSHKFPLEQVNDAFRQAEWVRESGDPTQVIRAALVP